MIGPTTRHRFVLACLAALAGAGCRSPEPEARSSDPAVVERPAAGAVGEPSSDQPTRASSAALERVLSAEWQRRSLAAGERHGYRIHLGAGRFAQVQVEQEGIDVALELYALERDGEVRLAEVDSPNGARGEERVSVLAAAATTTLRLVVIPSAARPAPGGYSVHLVERPAAPDDALRIEAEYSFWRARSLTHKATDASGQEAIRLWRRAEELWRRLGDRAGQGMANRRLGDLLYDRGELEAAVLPLDTALHHFRAVGDRAGIGRASNSLGRIHFRRGRPREALALFQQALAISDDIGEVNIRRAALSNIAAVQLSDLGLPRAALDTYRRLRGEYRAAGLLGREATTWVRIAHVYLDLREPRRALQALETAHRLARENGEPTTLARVLSSLGRAHAADGDYQRARDYFEAALEVYQRGTRRRSEAAALNSLARVYQHLGRDAEARAAAHRAVALYQEGAPRDLATARFNLGWILFEQDALDAAFEHYSAALLGFEQAGATVDQASAHFGLAQVARRRGQLAAARVGIERALALIEEVRERLPTPWLRTLLLAGKQPYYGFHVDVLMALHQRTPGAGFADLALQAVERARARGLLDSLIEAREGIRLGVDAGLIAEERRILETINALERERRQAARAAPESALAASLASQIDDLLDAHRSVKAKIRRRSPRYAALTQPQPLDLAAIQSRVLDPQSQLVVFALGEERSHVWVVGPSSVAVRELAAAEGISALARDAYRLLARSNERAVRGQLGLTLGALSALLLEPIAAELTAPRLLLVLDGALQYLPFGALPDPRIEGGLLLDRHQIVGLPSASVLDVLRGDAVRPRPPGAVAVIADPVFDAADPRLAAGGVRGPAAVASAEASEAWDPSRLVRLPFAAVEAEAIRALVPPGQYFEALGFDAERRIVEQGGLEAYRIVHFATHGVLHAEHPELSGLVLSTVDAEGAGRDGYLRVNEVYNLTLPVDLVVLSACQTALGDDLRGEGLVGLTRGFMYAGATRVVVSLWSIDDQATAELMKRFYRAMLVEELAPAAALHQAQRSLRREPGWTAPYFWAGFVLQGEPG